MSIEAQASYLDHILEIAKTDPVEAGEMYVAGLMQGNKADMRMGYSLGSALITVAEQLHLDARQTALVASRVADPKPGLVEYGPKR